MKKEALWTIAIVLGIAVLSYFILTKTSPITDEGVAKCIGKNSELYVRLGCSACRAQEELFGENYKYLNIIDCFYDREKCIEKQIEVTPTWLIKGKKIEEVQTIEKLKELTGC